MKPRIAECQKYLDAAFSHNLLLLKMNINNTGSGTGSCLCSNGLSDLNESRTGKLMQINCLAFLMVLTIFCPCGCSGVKSCKVSIYGRIGDIRPFLTNV